MDALVSGIRRYYHSTEPNRERPRAGSMIPNDGMLSKCLLLVKDVKALRCERPCGLVMALANWSTIHRMDGSGSLSLPSI